MFVREKVSLGKTRSAYPSDVMVELCGGKINKFRGVFGIGYIRSNGPIGDSRIWGITSPSVTGCLLWERLLRLSLK